MPKSIDATFIVDYIELEEENADFHPKSGLKKWVLAGKYAIAYVYRVGKEMTWSKKSV